MPSLTLPRQPDLLSPAPASPLTLPTLEAPSPLPLLLLVLGVLDLIESLACDPAPVSPLSPHADLLEQLRPGELCEYSPAVQRVRSLAVKHHDLVWEVLDLRCCEHHSAIQVLNKILKKSGYPDLIFRKLGRRGSQIRVWRFSASPRLGGDDAVCPF
jgi:hypothetical protein